MSGRTKLQSNPLEALAADSSNLPSPPERIASEPSTQEEADAARPPKLLDLLRREIRARHYSMRTEAAYVDWARRFILFNGKRHPQEMGAPEVGTFLSHLATDRSVSASTQNQAKSAILFLYGNVLGVTLP